MTLTYVGANSTPNYVALSTDIVSSKIAGANRVGNTVFILDNGDWFLIKDDLTLVDYGLPAVLTGDLTIGTVNQGDASLVEKWLVDASGSAIGIVTETAPATDTASSGLNGRLQRIAQRLTSLIALLPTALGANGGLKIEGVASGTVVPVSGTVTTGGLTDTQLRATAVPVSGTVTADTELPAAGSLTDATVNPSTTIVGSMGQMFNGTTWDRQRNNYEVTALASAARTSSTNSSDLINYNARGAIIVVDVTSLTLTGTITVSITGKDTLSGKYYTLLTGAALGITGTTAMVVYPGIPVSTNLAASMPLPRIWRVEVTAGNGVSITYSIGVNYIL